MNVAPTRAAALTPLSPAGIAVVGLIGPDAIALLDRVFRPRQSKMGPEAHAAWPPDRLRLGQIADGDEVIDDAIVAVRVDADGMGHVELTTHGGPRIVQRLLLTLKRHGATIVAADEMAADVWPVDGVLDREVCQWVPHAQTRRAAAWLLRQRELLPAAVQEIARLIAETPSAARDRMAALLETHVTAARMLHGFSIAIVGPPNAGKSTLANALCGKPRVLVSDIPGTTRDYVSEPAAIDGIPATLIDTAGLRHANDPIEAEAVLRARRQAAEADLRLVVLDMAAPMDEDSRNVLGEFAPKDPSLLVLNKADLPAALPADRLPSEWAHTATVASGAKGDGIEALRHQIASAIGLSPDFDRKAAVFTARQAGILKRALSAAPTERQRMTESLNGLLA